MADLSAYLEDDGEKTVSVDSMVLKDTKTSSILEIFNAYLNTQRFDDDACVVLTMPEATLKKYSEKINAGLWWMYNKFCKKDFGMMQLLVALETMVDANKLASMLDMDIKLLVAKEQGIHVTENDIEEVAERDVDDENPDENIKLSQDYIDKLTEDDPEEEAFILEGLSD